MCDNGAVSSQTKAGLTPGDLESLSAALASGKRVTVYLRDAMPSLNLEAGASARVVSIDGSTVTVSPRGVDDQLPFEADELRRNRTAPAPASSAGGRTSKRQPAQDVPVPVAKPATTESSPRQTPKRAQPVADTQSRAGEPAPSPATSKPPRKSKAPTAPTTVTITAAGESTWTVAVSHGTRKQGRPTEVTADRVARAMRELGDETAITAVDTVIESARSAAQRRIEELSQELEAARAALAHLDGPVGDD
ncbi:DUF6319 family protein [Gordonia terrae]